MPFLTTKQAYIKNLYTFVTKYSASQTQAHIKTHCSHTHEAVFLLTITNHYK